MSQFLLVLAVALTVGAIVFGIIVLVTGDDDGLRPVEPDGRTVPLPTERPLTENDLTEARFDTTLRGYRMASVDAALRRVAYDIGYKDELVKVLQAEVDALREGRFPDAEVLRRAREAALAPVAGQAAAAPGGADTAEPDSGSTEVAASPVGEDGDRAGNSGEEPPAAADQPAAAPADPAPEQGRPAQVSTEQDSIEQDSIEQDSIEQDSIEQDSIEPDHTEPETGQPDSGQQPESEGAAAEKAAGVAGER